MAQVFQINGTNLSYVMGANWDEQAEGDYLNGKAVHNRTRRHVLTTNVMTAAEFDTLFALEGQKVTLTTTNYSNRNGGYITYYDVGIKGVSGQHEGPVFQKVRIECLVRV